MGLLGFMDGQTPSKGVADLPGRGRPEGQGHAGQDARRHVRPVRRRFAGPITDNTGKELLPAGEKLKQSDLDQFPPGAPGNECTTCMYWWNDGITSDLPDLTP